MTELIVKEQGTGTNKTSLDLRDAKIELTFEIQDNTDITKRSSPHSLSFELPRTRTNDQFFAHYHEVNIANGTWSAYSETVAEVYDYGVVVLTGILQLNELTEEYYSVNILGITADVYKAIRGKSFADLFTHQIGNATDHALTSANIINSWTLTNDITVGTVGVGTVVYPLVDNGWYPSGWYLTALNYSFSGLNNTPTHIRPEHLKPSILVKYLFEQIFAYAGYTIAYGAGLTGKEFKTLYMLLATEQKSVAVRPMYGANVGIPSTITIAGGTPTALISFLPTDETGSFFDPDNLFVSGIFTAPFSGTFALNLNLALRSTSSTNYYFNVNVQSTTQTFSDSVLVPVGAAAGYLYTQMFTVTCSAGQTVNIYVGAECSQDVEIMPSLSGIGTTSVSVPLYDTDNPLGSVVDMSANMPDLTLDKFVKGIIEKFNIIIEYNPDKPTVIKLDTADNYFKTGTSKDWTQKLDLSKNVTIKPTTELQKKRIIFQDVEGEDHRNEWWQRNWGWVKGRYIFENDNDFATDEETIGEVFVPFRSQQIRNSSQTEQTIIPNVLISRQWVNSESGAKQISNKPILAYYNGLRNIGNGYSFLVDATYVTQYPLFSIYSRLPIDQTTIALNWGYDYPDDDTHILVNGIPLYFMYRKYWAEYLNELYSDDARMLTCSMYLTQQDVRDLRFNDKIYIRDAYYRVLKISNYTVSAKRPCNVQLLKVVDKGEWNCSIVPDIFNPNGTVSFVDAISGAPATARQDCCELFGYKWNTSTNQCFYKAVSPSIGGNPTEPIASTAFLQYGGQTDAPLPIPNSFNKSWSGVNVTGTESVFALEAQTTSNTYVDLVMVDGATTIPLEPNIIYGVDLNIIAVQIGGTSGTVGDTDYLKLSASVKNLKGVARSVGSFVTISSQSDHTNVHGFQWVITGGGTTPATLKLQVSGSTNHVIQFFVTAQITALNFLKFMKP